MTDFNKTVQRVMVAAINNGHDFLFVCGSHRIAHQRLSEFIRIVDQQGDGKLVKSVLRAQGLIRLTNNSNIAFTAVDRSPHIYSGTKMLVVIDEPWSAPPEWERFKKIQSAKFWMKGDGKKDENGF